MPPEKKWHLMCFVVKVIPGSWTAAASGPWWQQGRCLQSESDQRKMEIKRSWQMRCGGAGEEQNEVFKEEPLSFEVDAIFGPQGDAEKIPLPDRPLLDSTHSNNHPAQVRNLVGCASGVHGDQRLDAHPHSLECRRKHLDVSNFLGQFVLTSVLIRTQR